jgi:site-specific DNA-methyltransferase (adenine-specific)
MSGRVEVIGNATLYLGDCAEILPTLDRQDMCLTDPPYGIGEDGGRFRDRKGGGHRVLAKKSWDQSRPSADVFKLVLDCADDMVIWGGNYFADLLPASRAWLYWDKKMGGDFSDGELAWTNANRVLKSFSFCNKIAGKEHPTQKPDALMNWCLQMVPDARRIIDPFMGSGTTGCAALRDGSSFIGIERDPDYFEIACRRIEQAQSLAQRRFEPEGSLFGAIAA